MTESTLTGPGSPPVLPTVNLQGRPGVRQTHRPAPGGEGSDPIGEFFGEYEILGVLGRGGMGVVYKARHRGLDRLVALKVIRPSGPLDGEDASAEEMLRFRAEAAAVARLDHPNIVTLYEAGEAGGRLFFSMALVEGPTLADVVALCPLAPAAAARALHAVVGAVAYAHGRGVIHRDLKPENILQGADGRPRVTDFGIARCADDDCRLTQAGEAIGTPSYMPPEQAQGHHDRVGPAADVYALGATLYALLTGRPPFRAATGLETLRQVVERDPVSPRQLNPAVDRDLETICLKCLEKRPERRYASAAALAQDLERFLDGRPILARPQGPAGRALSWARRNPLVAGALAGVVTVFLVAFGLVSASFWRTEQARREEARQRTEAGLARDEARRLGEAERWERYLANMATVASAVESQNWTAARRAIHAAPKEHRGWEWLHYGPRLDSSRQKFRTAGGTITRIGFLGAGRVAAVDDMVQIHDLDQDRCARRFADYLVRQTTAFATAPNGRSLAYAKTDRTVCLYDLATDSLRHTWPAGSGAPVRLGFTPDGKNLHIFSDNNEVTVRDTATGALRWQARVGEGHAGLLGMNSSGRLLVVTGFKDRTADVWDLEAGRKVRTLPGGESSHVAATSPDGLRVVTTELFPSNVMRLWDVATGRELAVLAGHDNGVSALEFSPDGATLSSGSLDQTIRLWDGRTGAHRANLTGHIGRVGAVAYSPDGSRLASAAQDRTVRLWNVARGEAIAVLAGHERDVTAVAFSPDGQLIASGDDSATVRVWDAALAERNGRLRGHTAFVYGVAFHPDGRHVASASWDGTVRLWDATSGRTKTVFGRPGGAFVNSVAIHPEGRLLASIGRDDAVRLWDGETGQEVHRWSLRTNFWLDGRVTFSPTGERVAAGDRDGAVWVWDVRSRAQLAVLRGHTSTVQDVAFSPDGRLLASAGGLGDGTVRVWDTSTWALVCPRRGVLTGHTRSVLSLAFAPDGARLASGSVDGTARLWDTGTWAEVASLEHGTNVHGLAFTPDGTRLATGCADTTIRLWDVATAREVTELRGHARYVHSLAFSPDGTRLASGSGDNDVRIWDTKPTAVRARLEADPTPGPPPGPANWVSHRACPDRPSMLGR